jgi:hypothetical protein
MDPKWILKGLVESSFVVASILMALAVDEWAQNKEYEDLASQSLEIFEREILQNRARLADVGPYHGGIRDLLGQMAAMDEEGLDVRPIVEGLESPVLLSTAWETALATGALTHMEFQTVSALSLTYSIQEEFEQGGPSLPRFSSPETISAAQNRQQLSEAFRYVMDLTQGESELVAVYDEVLEVIDEALNREPTAQVGDTVES